MTQIQALENLSQTDLIKLIQTERQQHADDMDMLSKELAERPHAKIDRPMAIGCGRFGIGVKTSTVLDAAARHYDFVTNEKREQDRIELGKLRADNFLRYGAPTDLVAYQAWLEKVSRPCRSLRLQQRANEIELLVAQNKMSAAECFTQMRQLIPHPSDAPFTPLESNHQIDPLRGAAEWLVNNCGVTTAIELTKGLRIGYGRASRLIKSVLGEVDKTPEMQAFQVDETDKMQDSLVTKPFTDCTCPSGDGSLRWPCPVHPPEI